MFLGGGSGFDLGSQQQTAHCAAAGLTEGWPTGVVAGVEVEVVTGSDEVGCAGDAALLQASVEPIVPVHATLPQGVCEGMGGDVEGGL